MYTKYASQISLFQRGIEMSRLKTSFLLSDYSLNPAGAGKPLPSAVVRGTARFLEYDRAFQKVSVSPNKATCIDGRLPESGERPALPHLPGGALTLAMLRGSTRDVRGFHRDCKAMGLFSELLRYLQTQSPEADFELLRALHIDMSRYWGFVEAARSLVGDIAKESEFLKGISYEETFTETTTPALAVVNRSKIGYTLSQKHLAEELDIRAFSIDLWAVLPLAKQIVPLPSNEERRRVRELLCLWLCALTLRKVGSPQLHIEVV